MIWIEILPRCMQDSCVAETWMTTERKNGKGPENDGERWSRGRLRCERSVWGSPKTGKTGRWFKRSCMSCKDTTAAQDRKISVQRRHKIGQKHWWWRPEHMPGWGCVVMVGRSNFLGSESKRERDSKMSKENIFSLGSCVPCPGLEGTYRETGHINVNGRHWGCTLRGSNRQTGLATCVRSVQSHWNLHLEASSLV